MKNSKKDFNKPLVADFNDLITDKSDENNIKKINHFLEKNFRTDQERINFLNNNFYKPLAVAINDENLEVAKILIENGASFKVLATIDVNQALTMAENHELRNNIVFHDLFPYIEIIDDLVKLVSKNKTPEAQQNLVKLCQKALEEFNISPKILLNIPVDNEGNTLLHLAAKAGNHFIIEPLINLGADFNARNFNGEVAEANVNLLDKTKNAVGFKKQIHNKSSVSEILTSYREPETIIIHLPKVVVKIVEGYWAPGRFSREGSILNLKSTLLPSNSSLYLNPNPSSSSSILGKVSRLLRSPFSSRRASVSETNDSGYQTVESSDIPSRDDSTNFFSGDENRVLGSESSGSFDSRSRSTSTNSSFEELSSPFSNSQRMRTSSQEYLSSIPESYVLEERKAVKPQENPKTSPQSVTFHTVLENPISEQKQY